MRPLATLRDGWEGIERDQARLSTDLSIPESVQVYLDLQGEFEESLRETESFFREERIEYLAEFQRRLLRLCDLEGHR
ncbi:MAG: hypothetical protein EHM23_14990 [Acidobacteria bacterium]|nr:MAG: hypothetical protein EHM23_14990 [Acidobacteriota bacterium]